MPAQGHPYPFIQTNANFFIMPGDSSSFSGMYRKFSHLINKGNDELSIVHIGGSHIQMDIYTHRMRQRLQSFTPGLKGSRGFIFPYRIAKTNNPSNFQVTWTGLWTACKNTQQREPCPLGLSGISVRLADTLAMIQIVAKYDSLVNYDFNTVKIFCNRNKTDFNLKVFPENLAENSGFNDSLGYQWFSLRQYTDTLRLQIEQADTIPADPEIYGISLENSDPGVVYHSIGVNGATLQAYSFCNLFVPHLKALHPDLVILSIGTNDGYTRNFEPEKYHADYCQLLHMVKQAAPDAAILLTVPNDSYLYRKYVNHNTAVMRNEIYKLASQFNCAVWDFYTIMGGLNSASAWYNNGLMNRDKVHFNRPGYLLKGDLLFEAFIRSWERSLNE
jgi:lysophospholipase L1-like esterase